MLVKCVTHRKNSVMLAAPLMRMTGIKKKKDENCASTMQEGVGRTAIWLFSQTMWRGSSQKELTGSTLRTYVTLKSVQLSSTLFGKS